MTNSPSILPFDIGTTEYHYFADNRLRVALKGDLETGIVVETQKQQNRRAVQYLELYEIASAIAQEHQLTEEEAFEWVNEVASNPTRINELGKFAGNIRLVLEKAPIAEEIEAEECAVFMRYRAEYRTNSNSKGQWRSLNEWSKKQHGTEWGLAQQLQLPSSLNHEIYEVINNEKTSEGEDDSPLENEWHDSESGSETQQIGENSSGESN